MDMVILFLIMWFWVQPSGLKKADSEYETRPKWHRLLMFRLSVLMTWM